MDDRLARTIENLRNWDDLAILQRNVENKNALTDEVAAAIKIRAIELGRAYVAEKTGLDLGQLSPAEERIVQACAEYASVLRRQGKHPRRTIDQIRNNGLIGAAESAVSRGRQTQGFQTLAEEDLQELSYEQIVLDHADEFSPRAVWYARRTLGLPNASSQPPAHADNETQRRCLALLDWYEETAAECHGHLVGHTNETIAAVLGLHDTRTYGRVLGNIQSRIDFACYEGRLPPLGLTADAPYAEAWAQDDRDWAFPIVAMQRAAQSRHWTERDFAAIRNSLERLPGQAYVSWRAALNAKEEDPKVWAFSFENQAGSDSPRSAGETPNPEWSRDEQIVALDYYFNGKPRVGDLHFDDLVNLITTIAKVRRQVGVSPAAPHVQMTMALLSVFERFDSGNLSEGKDAESSALDVWRRFSTDRTRLAETAAAIRAAAESNDTPSIDGDNLDQEEAEEGRLLTRAHQSRERSRQLIVAKKKRALKEHGVLRCEACGFQFSTKYGETCASIIDCHHTKPVHTLREGDRTHIDDLALLCANCHRVVHASKRWLTIEELKARIEAASGGTR